MPPNVWGQREAMVEIHYNHYLGELRSPRKQRKYLKKIHIKCHIQNHIWGCHVQYTGTLAPLKYLITSYDTGTRPRILQRWIEATIYNEESSKYGSYVTDHNIVLCNLGYRCEPKVFIEIERNQYNPDHVNRCTEVEHGRNSIEYHSLSVIDNWSKGVH